MLARTLPLVVCMQLVSVARDLTSCVLPTLIGQVLVPNQAGTRPTRTRARPPPLCAHACRSPMHAHDALTLWRSAALRRSTPPGARAAGAHVRWRGPRPGSPPPPSPLPPVDDWSPCGAASTDVSSPSTRRGPLVVTPPRRDARSDTAPPRSQSRRLRSPKAACTPPACKAAERRVGVCLAE